jgi:hypothetical protein
MSVGSDLDGLPTQKVLRDLVALSAVPSAWVGREPQDIAADLADLLVTLLNLDFACVRLRNSDGSAASEIARGTAPPALLESLQRYLDERSRLSHPEVVPGAGDSEQGRSVIVLPLGINAEIGLVAAASDRPDFPSYCPWQPVMALRHSRWHASSRSIGAPGPRWPPASDRFARPVMNSR